MKEQAGTALQRTTEATPLRLVTLDDVFDRMENLYHTISRRAYEIFESNGRAFGPGPGRLV